MLVGDLFHPLDVLAVDDVRDGDMAHGVGGCRSMPMLHAGGRPDAIAWLDLPLRAAFFLNPPCSGRDDQVLAAGMRVPRGACSRLERHKPSRGGCAVVRGIQWV